MLLLLYDNTMRIYEWQINERDSDYKDELASEQLEEAKESKATAISIGKLSNLAFLYLPIKFVCTMLGMNLSIYGQRKVPVWVFLVLAVFFSLLTYWPIFLRPITPSTIRAWKLAYRLSWRSAPAGFWFLAFSLTHTRTQTFKIMYTGLAQELLGDINLKTENWMEVRNDHYVEKATWGSREFWNGRLKRIFLAVEGLNSNNGPM